MKLTYRFYKRFYNKAECEICCCLVQARIYIMVGHARYHRRKLEFSTLDECDQGHLDITLSEDIFQHTGWVCNDTGPG